MIYNLRLPVQSVLITSKVVTLILIPRNLLSIKTDITLLDKVLLTNTSRSLSLVSPVFTTNNTDYHDKSEI